MQHDEAGRATRRLRGLRAFRRTSRRPAAPARGSRRLGRVGLATAIVGASSVVFVVDLVDSPSVSAAPLCATPPTSGTATVAGVVNTYFPALTSVSAGTANPTVTVGAARGAAVALAPGDLVLVMQVQGAGISPVNTAAYGDGSGGGGRGFLNDADFVAGRYEYATVAGVSGSAVTLAGAGTNGGLVNAYVNAAATASSGQQRYQIVRVPQYATAVLGAATALPWDGASGGVFAIDASVVLDLAGGTVDVSGLGFRGGLQRRRSGAGGLSNNDFVTPTSATANGQKAEGIAGTPRWRTGDPDTVGDGYPGGDFGRGAPGNAGGGGTDGRPSANDENTGGGGGGNAGQGGRGGNSWNSNLNRGGVGGATVPGTADRTFLGGGGGAGTDNNAVGSSAGGAGGGAVLVRAGALTGSGNVLANGAAGSVSGQDGGGGGGAGGSVVVLTSATGAASGLSGLTVSAAGGAGGNTTYGSTDPDRHGPGGGGGGGRIVTSGAPSSTSVAGGLRGIHAPTNDVYGAQSGSAGTVTTSASITDVPGTDTGSRCVDVQVTKSVSLNPVVPGATVTYTVTATNAGPFPAVGTATVGVTDTLPAGLTGATWTCAASTGSSCAAASGSGSIATTANLTRGGSATYTVTGTLAPSFTGTLSNTATVTAPTGIVDVAPANNTATATAPAAPIADLSITKTDAATAVTPGTSVTYTVVVSNAGPSRAVGAAVADPLPAGATGGTWSCTGGACGSATGAMPMGATVTLDPGQTATYAVTVDVAPGATGTLTNTATVTAPASTTDPDPANNLATDTGTLTPVADLSIAKTDGVASRDAGAANPYTITVTNAGPSTIVGATVTDLFPADYTGVSWTCTAGPGSSCPSSGSGDITASVTVAAGSTLTFAVTGTISPSATASTLTNTATVSLPGGATDPTPANNTATDVTAITRAADLSITKTDGAATATPGASVTYTIVAANAGPSTAVDAVVADALPAELSGAVWTCAATPGSSCPASGSGDLAVPVTLAPGGSATFTVTANVDPTASGTLSNTATVTPPPGTTDPDPSNDTATDDSTLTPTADLSVTKTDGVADAVPGTSLTYTIVAANAGPSTVADALVADVFPAGFTGAAWTCAPAGGAVCPVSGSGDLAALVTLPPGGSATFTVTGTIDPAATGTLVNTVTVSPPGGVIDPDPGNDSASDTTALDPTGDLSITKTDGVTVAVPGTGVTYTIEVSNAGPSVMTAVAIDDPLPAALTGVGWTCAASGGAACPSASGTGDIADVVDLPVGGGLTYTVSGTVDPAATGVLENTAAVTPGPGTVDPDGSDNTATDTDALQPTADVSVTKTDGVTDAVPGDTVTYTVVVSNAGPSDAPGTVVTDSFPVELDAVTWSCAGAGGAVCPAASGSGDIADSVDLPVGASVTYTATGTVAPGATGSLTNTATAVVGPGIVDPDPSDNAATDVDVLTPLADLVITKTDGLAAAVPGQSLTYTIVATNAGPSTVTGASVVDPLPAELTGATWSCLASAGSSCAASGSGGINTSVTLLPGGTATFTLSATILPSATGTLSNTATIAAPGGVNDPTPANNTATDTTALTPTADLSVTKTNGGTTEVPGTGVVYTVTVANAGPSDVTGAAVTDVLPPVLTDVTWACVAGPGAACGDSSGTGDIVTTVDLPAGTDVTFTIVALVDPTATGTLVNTATVAAPPGVVDPQPANDSATDSDALAPTADLSIIKTDGVTAVTPGQAVTYTIVATNAGPSTVTDAAVADVFPAALTGVSWTCAASGGGTCGLASGTGSFNAGVTLPAGASATFTVDATVATSATGTLVNTATVSARAGVTDPDPSDNSATDTDTITATADLSITKTDGLASAVPGTTATYTIEVANAGPSAAVGAAVADVLPSELTGATWSCTGSGTCPSTGTGDLAATVDLPAGTSVTFTVTGTIDPAATGTLVNTATVAPPAGVVDPDPSDDSATDTTLLTPEADLSITKTDGVATAVPGGSTTYTVTVSNAGPSAVTAAPVTDPLPAAATAGTWTCTPASACAGAAGALPLATTVDLAPGASASFTIEVDIAAGATGALTNTATVDAPTGVVDPDPSDNAATDVDTLTPVADLSITKTDGLSTVVNGQLVTYTIVVTNPGPSVVAGATVADTVPAGLTGVTWSCVATGGSVCSPSGTGDIADAVTLEPSTTLTYTVTGTVAPTATGTLVNTATVTPPAGVDDPTPGDNTATDTTDVAPEADLSVTKTNGATELVPGTTTSYTVVVANAGPAAVVGATVTDALPTGATGATWTCAPAGGASCPAAGGTGAIAELVDLPVGASLTYTIDVAISPAATGTLTNVAAVSAPGAVVDPDPSNDQATDADPLAPAADVSITKTDGLTSAVPGTSVTYTVVVANAGPSDAPGTTVVDPEPVGATFTSWTCAPGAGAGCAAASGSGPIATTVDLPAGGSATFTVTAAIDPAVTGSLVNTATATVAPGIVDPVPGNDAASDSDTLTPRADLSVTKTNGVAFAVPGTSVTYTIDVANAGPSDVVAATVADVVPAELTGVTWTCAAGAGAACTASGSGDIADAIDLPAGSSVVYTLSGTVAASAAGTLDNTASVTAPAGVVDPDPGNDSATDSDPLVAEADLSITKTDGVTSAVPGTDVTYTIVASNAGPSAAPGTVIGDAFPAELAAVTWTCVGAGGAACPAAAGSGDIGATVDLPVGGSVTYTATGTVLPGSTGSLVNTATVAAGPGVGDPDPADNAATDVDALTPTVDLAVTKTNGVTSLVPGAQATYAITVTNAGPSAVAGATLGDVLPAELAAATWTCAASAGSVCPAAGSGDISAPVSLVPGGSATFIVTATVDPAATGTLANTAVVTAPAGTVDADPGNDSATDTDPLVPTADLSVTKTDGTPTATPGAATTYTMVVTNAGPSAVTGATVSDALPAGATAMSWTCTATPGSSCTAGGSGAIGDTVDLAPGGVATYVVDVSIDAAATGTLTNTVTVAAPAGVVDPNPGNDTATDVDALAPVADLSVTKTDGTPTATPGATTTYTIVVANAGPSTAVGATVTDALPAGATGGSWNCTATGGATCPAATGTGGIATTVDLPVGATLTYALTVSIDPAAAGTLTNTATVAVPAGTTDPDPTDDSATDVDTLTPVADLSITKTDGAATAVPGDTTAYTIVVANAGPSDVVGARVVDVVPASLTDAAWTCAPGTGASCPAGGSGDIDALVDLAVGATATFTLTAAIDPGATVALSNTATVAAPTGTTDPDPSDDAATDTTSLTPIADLSITKTDGLTSAQPGDPVTYTIVVANAGPSAVTAARVTDPIPGSLTAAAWTCTPAVGAACGAASSTGDVDTAVDLAPGASATFTITATVAATDGTITNTAQVDAPAGVVDPDGSDNAATDTTTVTPTADLSITKTDGLTTVSAGESITYTIVVTNAGPSTIVDARVTDAVPSQLASVAWSCTASPGSACDTSSGTGDLDELVTLTAGGSVTYTVAAQVPATSPAGTLTNEATVAMPPGTIDPTPGDNTAIDETTVERRADLSIAKTDGAATAVPGQPVEYTITVTNAGPAAVSAATVVDALPGSIGAATWTCTGTSGGTCTAAGAGDIADTVDLPVGATVTYTVVGTIDASATGLLVNTATVIAPADVLDPDPSDDSATDTTLLTPTADLSVTKSNGVAELVPGTATTYTVVVANAGPSAVSGATVTDTPPAALGGVTWTCSGTGGGSCTASGAGAITDTVDLPVGASVTYLLTATVEAAATGSLANTAAVTAPAGVIDPDPSNDSANDTDALTPRADLRITKTDGVATAVPGSTVTYTIEVVNAGPSDVTGALVDDPLPPSLSNATWTCAPTAGATCTTPGTGDIGDVVDLPVAASVVYTLTADVDPAATGTLTNTATVDVPAGVTELAPADNTASDVDTLTPTIDLSITKTDGLATARPGDPVTYIIEVANAGPSAAVGALVTDPIPGQLTGATWTCAPAPGSACGTAAGTGDVLTTVDLTVGGAATIVVTAQVAGDATGVTTNTATVTAAPGATDPDPSDNTATDTTTVDPRADLSITKTDGNATAIAGTAITYTIVVTNGGPSAIADAPVADAVPAALTGATWTCTASPGSSCDDATGTGSIATTVDLASGGTATFTVDATIAPDAVGTLTNTATVTMPAPGDDPDPSDNTATDTTLVVAQADIGVTKTDGTATATPGGSTTYTVVVANAGPSAAAGVTVSDPVPAGVTAVTWSCAATAGSSCTAASGSGPIATTVDLAAGGAATFTVTVDIDPAATGTLVNTVTVAAPAGVTDPNPADDTATDTDLLQPEADLAVTKTNGVSNAVPGQTVTYTITVSNAGPSDVTGATVADALPAALVGAVWTCTPGAGAACTASGTGDVIDAVDVPAGTSVVYTLTGTVDPAASGTLVNTATVTAPAGVVDPDPGNDTDTDTDTLLPTADLSITKTDGATTAVPGQPVTYTITVTNAGPSAVLGAVVADPLPPGITGATWTCAPAGGATCTPSGAGDLADVVDLPSGASIVYTFVADVDGAASGNLVNTASVTPPPTVDDPDPANNGATDTNALTPVADLSITKDDGRTDALPGDVLTYTIVVANAGPSAALAALVTDPLPAELSGATWTCAGAAGGACAAASGSGDIAGAVDLPAGASVTFAVTATVAAGNGSITNTAVVEAPAGVSDPDPADNSATDVTVITPTGDLSVTKTDGLASVVPGTPITYTIVVANSGSSAATGVTVADALPPSLTSATWTCVGSAAGAACTPSGTGDVVDLVDLPAGTSVTYTVVADVDASAAAGTLTNTVAITPPAGFVDTDPTNDTATDTTAIAPTVDLAITKTNGVSEAVPGLPVTYSIVVTNGGPSAAVDARVVDPLPAALAGGTWTCTAAAGSSCPVSGTGGIDATVLVGPGSSVTFTLTADVDPAATGTVVNTATVTPPAGTTDTSPGNDSATDTDALAPRADLSITKTDGRTSAVPGEPITYAITVTNAGPSAVDGARVTDPIPASLSGATWTCAAGTAGASCAQVSGTGAIDTLVDLPVGGSVLFEIAATIAPSASGTLVNTATVAAPAGTTDPDPGNDVATDTTALTPTVDLAITKDDGVTEAVPGTSVTYAIVVTNAGPSDSVGATLADPLPAGASAMTWSCAATGGAACGQPAGSGDISLPVDVPVGGQVTVTATVSIDPLATGVLANTASITAPAGTLELDPTDDVATDTDTLVPTADLSITKTDGLTDAVPGDPVQYVIVVTNGGPSAVVDAPVTDPVPTELDDVTWTCVATDGSCALASGTGSIATTVSLAPGGTATFTVDGEVADPVVGAVVNTATVDAPAGVVDPDPSDNAATDTTVVSPLGDVSVTKTDGVTSVVAGTATTYVVTVTNPGPSRLDAVRVQDPLPALLTGATWTCAPAGGATCAGAGSGSIDELVDLPAASSVTFTVDATVAPEASGQLVNTATATLPTGAVDPTPANNVATDVTDVVGVVALSITKDDGVATAVPGTDVTYTISATNAGPSAAIGARVVDPLPTGITSASWTCTGGAGGSCAASGTGGIDVPVTLPVGGTVTFVLTATIAPTASGSLVNTATIAAPSGAGDPDPSDNAATDVDLLVPTADIAVTKANGGTVVIPGTATTYTIVVSNLGGPSTVAGVVVDDPLPAGATGATWTCSAAPGSACGAASGSGPLSTTATVAPGADVTYTVVMDTAVVAGTLTNVVTATVPAGTVDPDPANNTATDIDTLQLTADLSVTKLASVDDIDPGDAFTFTVAVRNAGPNPLAGVAVDDPLPSGLTSATWTCLPSAGAVCTEDDGVGAIATTVSLDVGATATFVIVAITAPDATGSIVNTATVAPPAGAVDPDTANNSATDSVVLNPIILPPALELEKTTSSASFDAVGQQLAYTLVARNTGGVTLTDVRISDPGATIVSCDRTAPVSLAPGDTLTCEAVRTVAQSDLDAGGVDNTATVLGVDPDGNTVAAPSGTVTVPAVVRPSLSVVKSSSTTSYTSVGDVVRYSIVVTNTGNVTLADVTLTDTVATLVACPPRTLAPGASFTCAAERSVTQADIDRGRIDNIATVQAVSAAGGSVEAVSGTSNLVTVRRVVPLPGTGGSDGGDDGRRPLPGTGADVHGPIGLSLAVTALGLALTAISHRRRRA